MMERTVNSVCKAHYSLGYCSRINLSRKYDGNIQGNLYLP